MTKTCSTALVPIQLLKLGTHSFASRGRRCDLGRGYGSHAQPIRTLRVGVRFKQWCVPFSLSQPYSCVERQDLQQVDGESGGEESIRRAASVHMPAV